MVQPWETSSDIVYLSGFTEGRYEWDAAVLPYLWLWTELGATRDYPWWGGGRVLGLERSSCPRAANGLCGGGLA